MPLPSSPSHMPLPGSSHMPLPGSPLHIAPPRPIHAPAQQPSATNAHTSEGSPVQCLYDPLSSYPDGRPRPAVVSSSSRCPSGRSGCGCPPSCARCSSLGGDVHGIRTSASAQLAISWPSARHSSARHQLGISISWPSADHQPAIALIATSSSPVHLSS